MRFRIAGHKSAAMRIDERWANGWDGAERHEKLHRHAVDVELIRNPDLRTGRIKPSGHAAEIVLKLVKKLLVRRQFGKLI